MASIVSSKKDGDSVISEVVLDYQEYLQLKGHLNNVHLITENIADVQTNISQRGKNAATKYFLIPKQLRKGFKFNNETSCQKIELKDKVIFVYVVDKNKTNPTRRQIAIKKIEEKYGSKTLEFNR